MEKRKRRIRYIPIDLIDLPKIDVRSFRNPSRIEPLLRDFEDEEPIIPLTLRAKPNGRYECLDGARRLEALKRLGYKEASATIIEKNDVDAVFTSLILGLHRNGLDALGVCEALKHLCDTAKIRQKEIASRLCWSKGYVSKLIRIARYLDDDNKLLLAKGEMSIPEAYSKVSINRDYKGDVLNIPPKTEKCSICNNLFSESDIEKVKICFDCKRLLKEEKAKPKPQQKKLSLSQRRFTQ